MPSLTSIFRTLKLGASSLTLFLVIAVATTGQSREPYIEHFDRGTGGWLANWYDPLPIFDGVAYCFGPWYLDSHHAPPGDAALKFLTVAPGSISPGFNTQRKSYTVFVPHSCDSLNVTAVANDPGAALEVKGSSLVSGQASAPIGLDVGRNFVDVEITSADGKAKETYRVKVIRSYPTPNWVRVKGNNPWIPRDSAGELVFNSRMWLVGGYTPGVVNDVWNSPDGLDWSRTGEIPCSAGVNIPVNFVYNGKMWVTCNDGSFYSSSDGIHWTLVNGEIPWKGLYASGGAVFVGKMWALGRKKGGEPGNVIWSSADGIHWPLETAGTPFSKRQFFSDVVVHQDKLWVVGGGITSYHPFKAYNDVWNSTDGKTWAQVTDRAPWPPRIWNSTVAYKNRLWMMGGFRAEPAFANFNDVWFSADGADWNQLVSEEVWSPRHEFSAYVFDGKLWVVGGNAWPLQNDAWYLEIKGLTFLTQPVIEEFVGTEYIYRAWADFNASGQKVRYRLVEAPRWLSVDSDAGVIRGTPPEEGNFVVAVEAFDAAGETARQSFTLYVIKE
jgi:hypothetical protein